MNLDQYIADMSSAVIRDVSQMRDYQTMELVPFLIDNPFSAAFVDMGLGKTVSALTVISHLFDHGLVRKVLVIAPLRVAVQTWPTEIREWSHTWPLSFTLLRGDPHHPGLKLAERMARKLEADKDPEERAAGAASRARTAHMEKQKIKLAHENTCIHIIDRGAVPWLVKGFGSKWPYDCVIVDESRGFADHKSERHKALRSVRHLITRMHLLCGVPAPEGIVDYFGQLFLLDQGKRLGHNITAFRDMFMMPDKYVSHKYVPLPGAEVEVSNRIADICIRMDADDYLPRERATVTERPIILSDSEMKLYKEFERDFVLELPDVEIEAVNAGVLSGKLMQMASGAVYDENQNYHPIHEHKITELKEIVEEVPHEPLLVAYWHKSTLERLRKSFPMATVMDKEGACLKDWNAGKIPMLLVHPQSAGHGLNMQLGPGHILIWFDNPLPLDVYLQTIGRLDRSGQKSGRVQVIHLVAKGTADAKVVPMLRAKDDAQAAILSYIRDLRWRWKQRHGQARQQSGSHPRRDGGRTIDHL